jgi:hypothetical protein
MRFTVVFEGDVRKLGFNPMTAETPFGRVASVSVGDLLAQIDDIECAVEYMWPEADDLIDAIRDYPESKGQGEMNERETDHFHREVAAFVERYTPRSGYGRDFEHDLRMLLSLAIQEGQRPFAYELNRFRDAAIQDFSLNPMQPIIQKKTGPSNEG